MSTEQATKVVLCIDDYDLVLECLDFYLQDLGYSVLTASSGARGLEVIATHSVDVVIVDYHMPGLNGYQFALEMRDLGMQTPIIMFSGEADAPKDTLKIVDAFVPRRGLGLDNHSIKTCRCHETSPHDVNAAKRVTRIRSLTPTSPAITTLKNDAAIHAGGQEALAFLIV